MKVQAMKGCGDEAESAVVFVHSGESWFLPYALHQARNADPGSPIFLIGDHPPPQGVKSRTLKEFESEPARRFREVFTPMSPNPPEFELMCYLRWFYLSEFMAREGFEDAFYFDSDVLNYSSAQEMKATLLKGAECGLSVMMQPPDSCDWTACGHASYWKRDILDEFCEFCTLTYQSAEYLGKYREKLKWHEATGVAGGINDMTTLYLFWEKNRHRIANLATPRQGEAVDHNIISRWNDGVAEFEMESGVKKIEFSGGRPYGRLVDGDMVRLHSLHFQGTRKRLMPSYYTGPAFPGKRTLEFKLAVRAAAKAPRRWLGKKGE